MEADLAMSAGVDLRDLYRPGGGVSRLTLRRLLVLVRGLPADALTWLRLQADREVGEDGAPAGDDMVARLRERQAYYSNATRAG